MKFTRELESSDSDSKTHFGTHMIKPNLIHCVTLANILEVLKSTESLFVIYIGKQNSSHFIQDIPTYIVLTNIRFEHNMGAEMSF